MKLDRDRLIQAREALGYGLEKTAEEAGISKNSVLRAEHEEDIRPSTARKIAAALGVAVADLREESRPKAGAPLLYEKPYRGTEVDAEESLPEDSDEDLEAAIDKFFDALPELEKKRLEHARDLDEEDESLIKLILAAEEFRAVRERRGA